MAVPPLRQLGGAPAAMKGRGAAPWASRGRNRNTSASSAAARSLTSSLGSAPSSVTTAGTTRVSTPSLLAQTRSTRRPAASGEDEEGHASRRADRRRCQQCSTTCRRSPRKLLAAVVTRVLGLPRDRVVGTRSSCPTRGPVQPTATGLAPLSAGRSSSSAWTKTVPSTRKCSRATLPPAGSVGLDPA
jgi:hypothetical protein